VICCGKKGFCLGFGIALHTKDKELLQMLLDCGGDINCSGKPFPPLHNFADFNNTVGLQFLIEHGADINTKNQYKQTPLDRAKASNNQETVDFLRLHGAIEE
jgi:FOG: Ankyrin repeat